MAVRYERFRVVHRLAPVIYLMGWLHGLCLLPRIGVLTPVGLTLLLGGGPGALGALYSLFGRVGKNARHQGTVSALAPWMSAPWEIRVALTAPARLSSGAVRLLDSRRARRAPSLHPWSMSRQTAAPLTLAVRILRGSQLRWLHQHLPRWGCRHRDRPLWRLCPAGSCPRALGGRRYRHHPFVAWLEAPGTP